MHLRHVAACTGRATATRQRHRRSDTSNKPGGARVVSDRAPRNSVCALGEEGAVEAAPRGRHRLLSACRERGSDKPRLAVEGRWKSRLWAWAKALARHHMAMNE